MNCHPTLCPNNACDTAVCHSNTALFARAQAAIPGGVNSPVRAFKSVGGEPYFVARANGAYVWDVEGHQLIDYVQSYGAIALGHAHPGVVDAICKAAVDGTSYGAPTAREVLLAEAIRLRHPSCERVRLVNSGTEATMTVLRLARGATGRSKVVKFAGNYHGHGDALLAAGGSGIAVLGLSGSAGVTKEMVSQTIVAPYNVVPQLDSDVACVFVEAVAANMGLVAPATGFLEGLRAECDRVGSLLIFDEVITGMRIGHGGAEGAYGVTPDLACFGKIIGGGVPVGAFGGRADIMSHLAPLGPVYQAGTLSGNPLATAAGLTALNLLTPELYPELARRATKLAAGLSAACRVAGFAVHAPVVGPLVGLHFGTTLPTDYDSAKTTNESHYALDFHELLARGVAIAPGAYEVMFPGLAHTDSILDQTIEIAHHAALAASAKIA